VKPQEDVQHFFSPEQPDILEPVLVDEILNITTTTEHMAREEKYFSLLMKDGPLQTRTRISKSRCGAKSLAGH
jgi:hypothetical protein